MQSDTVSIFSLWW